MVLKCNVSDIRKMALKLSNQDKKDLDKFTKFFALKAAQIIIQSRLGEKVTTHCKPQTTGRDWVSYKNKIIYFIPLQINLFTV